MAGHIGNFPKLEALYFLDSIDPRQAKMILESLLEGFLAGYRERLTKL